MGEVTVERVGEPDTAAAPPAPQNPPAPVHTALSHLLRKWSTPLLSIQKNQRRQFLDFLIAHAANDRRTALDLPDGVGRGDTVQLAAAIKTVPGEGYVTPWSLPLIALGPLLRTVWRSENSRVRNVFLREDSEVKRDHVEVLFTEMIS